MRYNRFKMFFWILFIWGYYIILKNRQNLLLPYCIFSSLCLLFFYLPHQTPFHVFCIFFPQITILYICLEVWLSLLRLTVASSQKQLQYLGKDSPTFELIYIILPSWEFYFYIITKERICLANRKFIGSYGISKCNIKMMAFKHPWM